MATKLSGKLKLSKIPKELIQSDENGKYIWIDVVERKTPSQYGATHSLQVWNKATGETIYLADLKPRTFGAQSEQAPAPKNGNNSDLPDFF